MKTELTPPPAPLPELLITPDGRIYAHYVTPEIASLLSELDPNDETMRQRAQLRNTTS